MTSYIPRAADALVEAKLRSLPVVLVEGARGCGKTTTSQQFAASQFLYRVESHSGMSILQS